MKNVYILMAALFIGANTEAQIDFESSLSNPETFNNGSEGPEGFDFSPVQLVNYYDNEFSYFTGFAISNVTDNLTPGYMNQYSAYAGEGANNSITYAVAYGNPEFYTTYQQARITSFQISNTTYAGLSMRDGDSYAKKFGEPTNALGDLDGTDGEDFFKVWIFCENETEGAKDSIEFFLADYRFTDNSEDYIVDTWETIDLSALEFSVTKVSMRLESSDNGEFGMNTPAYVAIDNINWEGSFGISEVNESLFQIFPNPVKNDLFINGPSGTISLNTISGKEVLIFTHSAQSKINLSALPSGVYILNINTQNGIISKRIIK